ncbi:MAG TPA: SUMF1/EgtB/PvdO family nonheme iron enzyme [Polyangiaceae bacterium]
MSSRAGILVAVALVGELGSCAAHPVDRSSLEPPLQAGTTYTAAQPTVAAPTATSSEDASTQADSGAEASSTPPSGVCPSGMQHVKSDYCPELNRRCLDKEYDKPNHITICNRFAQDKPECRATRVPLDFCIDVFEYPNRAGAKPPVMLNFYEASGLCAAEHKRLCYESEWVAACEGPDEKPFPYGYVRSSEQCNFDNRWVDPHLDRVYAKDPEIARTELARLDRSLPSGQKAGCVSDYGVYDLTGNVDEWALADFDRPREHAKFAALKGGAWGHVRNACRPVTTSHVPEFRYYFIGFRCCSEPSRE